MHTELGIHTGNVIITITSHAIWATGPPGGDQWVISGGSRLGRSVKWSHPGPAAEENRDTSELARATGSGQLDEVLYPGVGSAAVS